MTHKAHILTKVKETVLAIEPQAEIRLFGSRARGDEREDSDWDFLILLDTPITFAQQEKIRDEIYEVELETGEIITSIIESKSEWSKYGETSIYKNIEKQGITLV